MASLAYSLDVPFSKTLQIETKRTKHYSITNQSNEEERSTNLGTFPFPL
jgi:hypothetical protein